MVKAETKKTVADLKPWEQNPREISELAAKGLKFSMEQFGDISGIVYNLRTDRIVCGHQRIENIPSGMKITNITEFVDDKGTRAFGAIRNGKALWPVRFVDWDEDTELAANITANNPGITGTFTLELDSMLATLKNIQPDVYDATMMARLLDGVPSIGDLPDPNAHWKGMPEFEQEEDSAWKTILVRFDNEDDLAAFAKLINQTVTLHTKSIWFPYKPEEKFKVVESEP